MIPEYRNALVVDDERTIHEMYDLFLGSSAETGADPNPASTSPFHVLHASGGQEAIDLTESRTLENAPIQVAFVDLKMTPIDGVATIKRLHAIDERIIFVIVTGMPEEAVGDLIDELGGIPVQIILKPFEASQIINVAEELCGQWSRNYLN